MIEGECEGTKSTTKSDDKLQFEREQFCQKKKKEEE